MSKTITVAAVRRAPAPPALGGLGLFTVLLAAALPLVDFFIVNVALPTMGADLHASEAVLELVVAGYGWRTPCCSCSAAGSGTCSAAAGCSSAAWRPSG